MALRQSFTPILDRLESQHPNAWTELHFTSPFELLVATILSAQCTDARVNQVTPALFVRYPSPEALASAAPDEVERMVQPTGFFRAKTRSLIGMAQAVVARHGGQIPQDMALLTELPGVGRKTANVVRGHAFHLPGLPVDRHVLRVANRLGLVHSDDPEVVEAALGAGLPESRWTQASDTLILHGRRVCKPKPLCDRCQVRNECRYFKNLGPSTRKRAKPPRTAAPRKARVSKVRR